MNVKEEGKKGVAPETKAPTRQDSGRIRLEIVSFLAFRCIALSGPFNVRKQCCQAYYCAELGKVVPCEVTRL